MKCTPLLILLSILSCNSKQANKNNEQQSIRQDCSVYNEKYQEYAMANQKDSAFYFIDKAIDCEPEDTFFKTEKINLFIKYKEYSNAINFAKSLSESGDLTQRFLFGVLLLKEQRSNAETVLRQVYDEMMKKDFSYDDSNRSWHFYSIALVNYFENNEKALQLVDKFKSNYEDEYSKQLAEVITDLINSETKEKLLFKIFNMK